MPKASAPDVLTGKAKEIWEKAYQSAWDDWNAKKDAGKTDKTQEEYAAAIAWTAVKKAGYKKNKDGKWVQAKSMLVNFRLRITKSRVDGATGRIRWHANAAREEIDSEDEVLTKELFDDLATTFQEIRAAYDNGDTPPVYDLMLGPAREPILDMAHYSALLGKEDRELAKIGIINKLYRDGDHLHADGYFDDTAHALAVAKRIAADEANELRVSVGFFPDWGNIEVKNDILYFKGGRKKAYLDHLAITSVPRIKSTTIDIEDGGVLMSEVTTMADDVKKILGDWEGADEAISNLEDAIDRRLQNLSMVMKGEVETEPEAAVDTPENEGVVTEEETVETASNGETPEEEPVEMEILSEGEREKAAKAQKARSKKYGIAILDPTNVTKPGKWEQLSDAQFGDPVNYRYPLPDKAHADNAMARYKQEKDTSYKGYKKIGDRILAAQKKFGTKAAKEKSEVAAVDVIDIPAEQDVVTSMLDSPLGGATTFEDALSIEQARQERWRLEDGWRLLQTVMDNIFADDKILDKQAAISKAVADYQKFVERGTEIFSNAVTRGGTDKMDGEILEIEADETIVETTPVVEEPTVVENVAVEPVVETIEETTETEVEAVEETETVVPPVVEAQTLQPKGGRAKSFSEVVDRIMLPKQRPQLRSTSPTESVGGTEMVAADVVAEQVAHAVAPILQELTELKEAMHASVNSSQVAPPARKSQPTAPPIEPAAVTTKAKTFSEVFDRLIRSRQGRSEIRVD